MEDEDDFEEVEMRMEASPDATEVSIVFTKKTQITTGDLILSLEEYLTELTRAEADKRRPGVNVH